MKDLTIFWNTILVVIFLTAFAEAQNNSPARYAGLKDEPRKVSVSKGTTDVPMEIVRRTIYVDVKINGKGPFKFIFDTGAGATVLDQTLADELGLLKIGTTKIGDPVDPEGITADKNHIATLEIGGAVFKDFFAVSWDRSGLKREGDPRGILGLPLFKKLLLMVDYPRDQITIAKGSLPKANGSNIFDICPHEAGLICISVNVAGTEYEATLDTGSQSSISFPNSFMNKLPLEDTPVVIGRGRTVGGEFSVYGAKLKGKISIGKYEYENMSVRFFDRLKQMNLGYELLSSYALTIDQKHSRLKIEKH
jgi:predicted aspartyl protease